MRAAELRLLVARAEGALGQPLLYPTPETAPMDSVEVEAGLTELYPAVARAAAESSL